MIDLNTTPRINIRIDEFCELFGVSRRTVYYWFQKGWIGFVYLSSERRIPIQEVRDLASGKKQLPRKPNPVAGKQKLSTPVQSQAIAS